MKELDFLPKSFHDAIRRRRRNRRNALYCFAVATLLAVFHGVNASQIRSAQAALNVMQADASLRTRQRVRLASLKQTRTTLQKRAELLGQLVDDAPLDAIIAEINRLMGPTTSLRSVSITTAVSPASDKTDKQTTPDKKDPDAIRERGRTEGALQGVAANDVEVGTFFGRLSSGPLFEEVRLSYSREAQQSGKSMREFELKFAVRRVDLQGQAHSDPTGPATSQGDGK